jgi:acetyl esterase
MSYFPTPTTKDLSILDPELRGIIQLLPDTAETAKKAETVVAFMRAIPPRPHHHPEVDKVDLLVSTEDAAPDQPPTSVRLYIPRKAVKEKGKLPAVVWSVS